MCKPLKIYIHTSEQFPGTERAFGDSQLFNYNYGNKVYNFIVTLISEAFLGQNR